MAFSFQVIGKNRKYPARTGVITTSHGLIETPCFVPVGTQATVKSLDPDDLKTLGISLFFVNTYHAYLRPGIRVIEKAGGLHAFMHWDRPLITDSGGFQVFSLGAKKFVNIAISESAVLDRKRFTKKQSRKMDIADNVNPDDYKPVGELVKIDEDGVTFTSHIDGSKHRFTPEVSIGIQKALGADIIIAFDECAPYPTSHEYASMALTRTHAWLTRSVAAHKKDSRTGQALYGVVQGSVFRDLRVKSCRFVSEQDVEGIAIGGVSVGESKKQMQDVLSWVMPNLPDEKPRHLLGVGEIDDVFTIIENGVDTFDCVQPTRLARMGYLYVYPGVVNAGTRPFQMHITDRMYHDDMSPVDPGCGCTTCRDFSRAYLNHLFRARELLGYRLATIHNIYSMQRLVSDIRTSLENGTYAKLKRKFLG